MAYTYLIDVIPHEKRWNIVMHRSTGEKMVIAQFRLKFNAVAFGRNMGRAIAAEQGLNLRLEMMVRNRDGTIRRKFSYGSDPRSING